jgi:hypothetical protein
MEARPEGRFKCEHFCSLLSAEETPQAGWSVGIAFSQARIYGRFVSLQADAVEVETLEKHGGN